MDLREKFSDTMARKVNGKAEETVKFIYKQAIEFLRVHRCSSQSIFENFFCIQCCGNFQCEYYCFRLICFFFSLTLTRCIALLLLTIESNSFMAEKVAVVSVCYSGS